MKKKRSLLKTISIFGSLGLLGAFLVWLAVNLISGSSERIEIAPGTTFITTPSQSNSTQVDYAEYINQKLSLGVTRENNAALIILKYIPSLGSEEFAAQYFKLLGVQESEIEKSEFVTHESVLHELWAEREKHLKQSGQWNESTSQSERDRLFSLNSTPWSSKDYPTLKKWIDQHQVQLDTIREASQRSHFYSPLISIKQAGLLSAPLPVTQRIRELARGLSLRAMNRLGEGDWQGCQADLIAIRRLASLAASGPALVHQLISYAVFGLARKAEMNFARSDNVTPEQLKSYLQKIEKLKPEISQLRQTTEFERIMVLDAVTKIAYNGADGLQTVFAMTRSGRQSANSVSTKFITDMAISMVDWNVVMREVNKTFDHFDQIMLGGDMASHISGAEKIEYELNIRQEKLQQHSTVVLTILGGRKAKGRYAADFVLGRLLPGFHVIVNARNDAIIQEELIRVMIACEIFRREHQSYPAELQQIAELPGVNIIDPYTHRPFVYQTEMEPQSESPQSESPQSETPRIYSLGPNQTDDAGRSRFSQPSGDDVLISYE